MQTHAKAEGLLFREKEAKSFCLFAPDRFWPSLLDGELTKVFWSFFSKKDCLPDERSSTRAGIRA
jgi:hypothetical protein